MNNPYGFNELFLELHGQKSLYIENFKRILKYTPNEIIVQSSRGKLLLSGEQLYIKKYSYEEIRIDGIIDTISFLS